MKSYSDKNTKNENGVVKKKRKQRKRKIDNGNVRSGQGHGWRRWPDSKLKMMHSRGH